MFIWKNVKLSIFEVKWFEIFPLTSFFHFLEAKLKGMERNGLVKSPGENLMDKTTIVLQE